MPSQFNQNANVQNQLNNGEALPVSEAMFVPNVLSGPNNNNPDNVVTLPGESIIGPSSSGTNVSSFSPLVSGSVPRFPGHALIHGFGDIAASAAPRIFTSITRDQMIINIVYEVHDAMDYMRNGGTLYREDLVALSRSILLNSYQTRNDIVQQVNNIEIPTYQMAGLSENEILVYIDSETFRFVPGIQESEVCCICQENYCTGEELGILDCRHRCHLPCITQWLMSKNTCPICKQQALTIPENKDEDQEEQVEGDEMMEEDEGLEEGEVIDDNDDVDSEARDGHE
ncbi:hypothetical protein RIF29_37042 [Crotalaria pallida]|uniref:RING-type E3 ubiquitin transferase n=1 Tax=Crotalaria pallida TaxID=3830 RepID=A0AAN9EH98_CROPI